MKKTENYVLFVAFGFLSAIILFGGIIFFLRDGREPSVAGERGSADMQKSKEGDLLVTPAWKVFRPEVLSSDPVRGARDAPVDIVMFGGFGCAACKDVQPTLSRILEDYAGMVRLVWKDFPDPRNPNSRTAARAARCAQVQGKFWQYHDLLFQWQGSFSNEAYLQIAQELKLDEDAFSQCLESEDIFSLVGSGMEEAQRVRVDTLPSIFVNGRRIEGSFSYPEIQALIMRALKDITL